MDNEKYKNNLENVNTSSTFVEKGEVSVDIESKEAKKEGVVEGKGVERKVVEGVESKESKPKVIQEEERLGYDLSNVSFDHSGGVEKAATWRKAFLRKQEKKIAV